MVWSLNAFRQICIGYMRYNYSWTICGRACMLWNKKMSCSYDISMRTQNQHLIITVWTWVLLCLLHSLVMPLSLSAHTHCCSFIVEEVHACVCCAGGTGLKSEVTSLCPKLGPSCHQPPQPQALWDAPLARVQCHIQNTASFNKAQQNICRSRQDSIQTWPLSQWQESENYEHSLC